jgi:hypothetical protein
MQTVLLPATWKTWTGYVLYRSRKAAARDMAAAAHTQRQKRRSLLRWSDWAVGKQMRRACLVRADAHARRTALHTALACWADTVLNEVRLLHKGNTIYLPTRIEKLELSPGSIKT